MFQDGSLRLKNRGGHGTASLTLKKACWIYLLLWQSMAQAQTLNQSVQITVNVLPPYSAYIQDYASAGRQVQIFIRNTTANTQNLRLVGTVTGDNGVVIQTQANYRPPVPLRLAPFENRLLSQVDLEGLFDLNQIDVQGIDKNRLYRGYPLPDGNYQLCVKAFDNARNLQLSPDFPLGCSGMFILKSIEPPILISPMNGMEVPATIPQTLTFNWTPPVGVPPTSISYTLRIIELPNSQIDPNVYIDAVALPKSGLEVKDLRTSVFLYSPQYPPLMVGKRYAWRVQAIDRFGKLNFLNDGKSPVGEFTYGIVDSKFKKPGMEVAQSPTMQLPLPGFQPVTNPLDTLKKKDYVLKTQGLSIGCSCKVDLGDLDKQKVDNSTVLANRVATVAGFQLTLLDDVKEDESGYLNGKGTVPIPMINNQYARLRVQLYNVQCNAEGQVIGGVVRGIYSGNTSFKPNWDKPDYSPTPLTTEQISNIGDFFTNQKDRLVSSLKNSAKSIGFELPFGIDKQFGPVKSVVAVTNITFTPKEAFFDANTWITLPTAPGGFNGIALSGYNLCLSPQKPCGEGILFLAQDTKLSEYAALKGANLVIPGNNPIYKPDTTQATYAVFDENGYHHLSAKVGIKPPKLLKASDNTPVEIIFGAYFPTPSFSQWTATLEFPDFYVDGLKDFVFSTNNQKVIYDHSDQPDSYVALLPNNYPEPGQKPGGEWRGLFFPSLSMTLPAVFERADGKKLTVGVKNMIYDNNGFSGKAFAANILDLGDGSLQGWYFAIDTVSVDFLTSKFKSAGVFGRIVLPIFKYKDGSKDGEGMEQSSLWPYSCTLSKDDTKGMTYEFNVSPSQDAQVDIWKAKLSILKGTSIKIGNSTGTFNAVATLHAKLGFQITSFFAPGVEVHNMILQSNGPDYFSPGSINMALASPQKTSGGLPFTLTNPSLVSNGANQYRFKFTGVLNLSEAAQFTAEATCYLDFKVGVKANKRPNFDIMKYGVEHIGGDKQFVGLMYLKFDLDFYENDPTYGDGFGGKASLRFTETGSGIDIASKFGKFQGYNYFYVGGVYNMPKPARIPLFPGVFYLSGFGGGIYYNMNYNPADVSYKPSKGKMGMQAKVLANTVDGYVLNTDMQLTMQLNEDAAGLHMDKISLDGNAYLLAVPNLDNPMVMASSEPGSPLAKGHAYFQYSFAEKVFDGNASLTAAYAAGTFKITATNSLSIHASSQGWYLAIGTPKQRNNLTVSAGGKDLGKFGSYLIAGSMSPPGETVLPTELYGLDASFVAKLQGSKVGGNWISSNPNSPILAFGAGFGVGYEYKVPPFFLSFNGGVGFDLALIKPDQPCPGFANMGVNGWYAMGQLYAGLSFALGIDVDLWFASGRFKAVEVSAGALMKGGVMNPIWFQGRVFLKYKILGGAIKGSHDMDFAYNETQKCDVPLEAPNPFAENPLISKLGPSGNDAVSILSPFYAEFGYPINSIIQTEYMDKDNKTIKRDFRIDYKKGEQFKLTLKSGIPAGFEGCADNNEGRHSFGQDEEGQNRSATFARNNALLPNSTYALTVGVEVKVRSNNQWVVYEYQGKKAKAEPVQQSETVTFKTGACIDVLTTKGSETNESTVAFTYPFEGQRYFMKDESKQGLVRLTASMACCMKNLNSNEFYTLNARFIPYKEGSFIPTQQGGALLSPAQFDGSVITYAIPSGLLNSTLYRVDIVRIPTDAFLTKQTDELAKIKENAKTFALENNTSSVSKWLDPQPGKSLGNNAQLPKGGGLGPNGLAVNEKAQSNTVEAIQKYVQQNYADAVNVPISSKIITDYKFLNAAGVNIEKLTDNFNSKERDKLKYEQVKYSYYFKTSKYNTMAQKVQKAAIDSPSQEVTKWLYQGEEYIYSAPFKLDENFDTYEIAGQTIGNKGAKMYLPPLFGLKATRNNKWVTGFLEPLETKVDAAYNKLGGVSGGIGIDGMVAKMARITPYVDSYVYSSAEPPLSKEKIDALLFDALLKYLAGGK